MKYLIPAILSLHVQIMPTANLNEGGTCTYTNHLLGALFAATASIMSTTIQSGLQQHGSLCRH